MTIARTATSAFVQAAWLAGSLLFASTSLQAQPSEAETCKSGKSDAARDACTRLIDQGTLAGNDLAEVHYRRALAYIALYKRPLAVADLDRAIALAPEFAAAYVARAGARRTNSGDTENMQLARADYDKAIALDPNSYEAVHFRGTFRDWMKDYAGAIADYTRALEIKPDDINSLHMRERAYRHVGEFAKALADSERLIVLDPKFNERLLNRASAYLAVGALDRALADYDAYDKLHPRHPSVAAGRGAVYEAKGDYQRALAEYEAALTIAPQIVSLYASRAWINYKLGNIDKGLADVDLILAKGWRKDARTFTTRGHLLEAAGRKDEAIADLKTALTLDPDTRTRERAAAALTRLGAG